MGCSSSLTRTLGKMAVGVEWTLLAKVLLLGPWQRTWGDGLIFRGELVGPASLHAAGQGGHMGSQGLFLGGGCLVLWHQGWQVHTPGPPPAPLVSQGLSSRWLCSWRVGEGVKKPGDLLCNLSGGVQLRLEPAFGNSEQGVHLHLIPRHEARLLCPPMECCQSLTGRGSTLGQNFLFYMAVVFGRCWGRDK